jgi:hypothetical protein
MGSLFEDIRNGIRDGIEFVADKTDEYTKIGKIKVEILSIQRNIEKSFSELGGRVYDLFGQDAKGQIAGDEQVVTLVGALKDLEKKLDDKKDEIKAVKDEKEKQRQEKGAGK